MNMKHTTTSEDLNIKAQRLAAAEAVEERRIDREVDTDMRNEKLADLRENLVSRHKTSRRREGPLRAHRRRICDHR
jgi:hypothetical protein